ncbi:MAG: cytochrome b N-terminal domain-containing protein [Anaerolineaceae bacterium]|nr:cytochrome b N-terminal domain-containing protein [Anaerolineaceae bacterium]
MTESKLTWKEKIFYTTPNDDRSRMRTVANNLILHIHPTKVAKPALRFSYTWGLGGISSVLVLFLVLTGVLLMFRYDASVESAYTSIQYLETQVAFGALIRGVHHWSANLLVVTVFLHMIRVFLTGGFKKGRALNWLLGLFLLLLVLAFNFTGYLLPWDQLAYWAITVGTSLLSYLPLVGTAVSNFLLGGPEVGQTTLRNFYAIHVAVLPAIMILAMSYHFWRVRKDGGISQPESGERERVEKVTTIPHLVQIELAATAVLTLVILVWAIFVPAPLEALANPSHPPNPAKAAWYFLGLQELLLHMHPLAAMLLPLTLLGGIALLPKLDPQEDNVGVYFRSLKGRFAALFGALLGLLLVPLAVLLDEYWLDLPGLFPLLPTLITTGLIPLLATLVTFGLIYSYFRWAGRLNHSEALVGLFSFIMTSFVTLTLIGIFFRGANMALVLPF